MKIIGCDFHTRYQQIAMLDEATGELVERRLDHENGEAAGGTPFTIDFEFSGGASFTLSVKDAGFSGAVQFGFSHL